MANIANVLKSEISRLARKETRAEIDALRKTSSTQRSEIAALKRRVQDLEKMLTTLSKRLDGAPSRGRAKAEASADEAGARHRFSAKGMASNRKRLGLSAAEFAALVGTTEQSIYAWEAGRTQPRAKFLDAIAALRGVGKREIKARLAALQPAGS
jgi:DNA-binding transcriptional regulator YiaG